MALSAAAALLAVTGLAVPAQAADWKAYGAYNSKSLCIDAGQQYEREGFNAYKCTESGEYPPWTLWLK
jgi:hypothetical protein